MKKLVILLPLIILLACSVQKRKYQNGYYVDWRNKKSSGAKSLVEKNKTREQKEKTSTKKEIALSSGDQKESTEANLRLNSLLFIKQSSPFKHLPDSCDLIFFRDGTEISAKVEEIGTHEIKYKRCDNLNGPSYRTKKSDIFMIKYTNGSKEVYKSEDPILETSAEPQYLKTNPKKINHPLSSASLSMGIVAMCMGFILLLAFALGESSEVLIVALILGLIAFILGIAAMAMIQKYKDKYKGIGLAISGLVMGLIVALISIAILISEN